MQLRFSARSSHHCSEYVANSSGRYLKQWSHSLLVVAVVSFSSCQLNLIKKFQIEAMITLITKMALLFS